MSSNVDVEVISDDDDWDIIRFHHEPLLTDLAFTENKTTSIIDIVDSDSDTISTADTYQFDLTLSKKIAGTGNNYDSASISRNVALLKQCRLLEIKVVDCNKFPWYYKKYKPVQNMFTTSPKSKVKIRPVDISTYLKSDMISNLTKNKSIGSENNNKSGIDFKNNQGLIGLKISHCDNNKISTDSNVKLGSHVNSKPIQENSKICKSKNSDLFKRIVPSHVDLSLIQSNLDKTLNKNSGLNTSKVNGSNISSIIFNKQCKTTKKMFNESKTILLSNEDSNAKKNNRSILLSNTNFAFNNSEQGNLNHMASLKSNKKISRNQENDKLTLLKKTTRKKNFQEKNKMRHIKENHKETLLEKTIRVNKLILGTKLACDDAVKITDKIHYQNGSANKYCSKNISLDPKNNNLSKNICEDKYENVNIMLSNNSTYKSSNLKQNTNKNEFDKLRNVSEIGPKNVCSNDKRKSDEDQNKSKSRKNELLNNLNTNLINHYKSIETASDSINNPLNIKKHNINKNLCSDENFSKSITVPFETETLTDKLQLISINNLNKDLLCDQKQNDKVSAGNKTVANFKLTQNSLISTSNAGMSITSNNKTSQICEHAISKNNVNLSEPYDLISHFNNHVKSDNINVVSQPITAVSVNNQTVEVRNLTTILQGSITNSGKNTHGLVKNLAAKFTEINATNTTKNNVQHEGKPIETYISNRITCEHRLIPPTLINHNQKLYPSSKLPVEQTAKPCFYGTGTESRNKLLNKNIYLNKYPKQSIHHPVKNNNIYLPRYPATQSMLNKIPNRFNHGQISQSNFRALNPGYNLYPRVPPPPYRHTFQIPQLPHIFQSPPQPVSHSTRPPSIFPHSFQAPPPYPPLPPFLQPPPPPPPPPTPPPITTKLSCLPSNHPTPISSPNASTLPSLPLVTQSIPSEYTLTFDKKKKTLSSSLQSTPLSTSVPITLSTSLPLTSTPTLTTQATTFVPSTPIHTMPSSVEPLPLANISHAPLNRLEGTKIIGLNQNGFIRTIAIRKISTKNNANLLSPKRNSNSKPPNSSTGYSPPILPIRTYEEYFEILAKNEKRIRYIDPSVEVPSDNHTVMEANNEVDNRKRNVPLESNLDKSNKKIRIDFYTEKLINECLGKETDVKEKIEPEINLQSKKSLD